MRIALDPFMHRHLPLEQLPDLAARLGYEWIELSPRSDFLEWFKAPRVFPDRIRTFRKALSDAKVGIASLLPMYRWASNDEAERQAAVRHWKRAIEIAVEMGVDTLNSEFGRGPHPDKATCYCCHTGSMVEACEDAWWRSMDELVPILEREGITLHIEPHPEDWVETLQPSVDLIRCGASRTATAQADGGFMIIEPRPDTSHLLFDASSHEGESAGYSLASCVAKSSALRTFSLFAVMFSFWSTSTAPNALKIAPAVSTESDVVPSPMPNA
jgi:sugar phosphate isomerase/epimerase